MTQERMTRKQQKWHAIVADFRQSGKSQINFARERGLSINTLRYWCAKFSSEDFAPEGFARVVVEAPRKFAMATVRLPSGVEIELSEQLALMMVERLMLPRKRP